MPGLPNEGTMTGQQPVAAAVQCQDAPAVTKTDLGKAKLDSLVLLTTMTSMSIGALKFRGAIPPTALPGFALALFLSLGVSCWAHLAWRSYTRWRGAIIAVVRIVYTAAPLTQYCLLTVGSHYTLNSPTNAFFSAPIFALALLFVSQAFRLAIVGLGLPLRAPAHAAVQLAMLLLVRKQSADTCSVILQLPAAASSPSSAWPSAILPSSYARPHTAIASAAVGTRVAELVESFYSSISVLPMLLPVPLVPTPHTSPSQQCRCLVELVQLVLGFWLPVAVQLVGESRTYCLEHPCRGGGRREGLLQRTYRMVWGALEGTSATILGGYVLGLLALTWLAVVASV